MASEQASRFAAVNTSTPRESANARNSGARARACAGFVHPLAQGPDPIDRLPRGSPAPVAVSCRVRFRRCPGRWRAAGRKIPAFLLHRRGPAGIRQRNRKDFARRDTPARRSRRPATTSAARGSSTASEADRRCDSRPAAEERANRARGAGQQNQGEGHERDPSRCARPSARTNRSIAAHQRSAISITTGRSGKSA